jgi:DNA-directed RNA polymerase specialized sigma24 family protein
MNRPHADLIQALRSDQLAAAMPQLVAFAALQLGPAGDPRDVFDTAVQACLEGGRQWPEAVGLESFLCGVISSVVSSMRRSAARRRTAPLEEAGEVAAPFWECDLAIDRRRVIAAVDRAMGGDADLEALFAVIVDGVEKRAEQAAALGWTPERVKATRLRMKRRLAAEGLGEGDHDDRLEEPGPEPGAGAPRPRPRRRAAQ